MLTGNLTKWFADRGFGFLTRSDRRDDEVFVHAAQMEAAGIVAPQVGQRFAFLVEVDPKRKGRRRAVDLKLLDQHAPAPAADDVGSY